MKKEDLTLRYMERFGCIGPECEDHCCHTWRVDVDPNTHKRLMMMANTSPEDRKLFRRVIRKHVERDPKTNKERTRYIIDMKADGYCPMLDEQGLCNIHKRYGEKYLSLVCTTFPRRLQRIDDRYELSAMLSCPEVTRQLLLHADAIDVVPFDRDSVARMRPSTKIDPADARPFMRRQHAAREVMWRLIRLPGYSIEQRLFFMTYFAKRTTPIMARSVLAGDIELVEREQAQLENPAVLDALQRRFNALQTPSTIVLLLIQELVSPRAKIGMRTSFRGLVEGVINSYAELEDVVFPETDDDELKINGGVVDGFWGEYLRRKAVTEALAAARVDQYFTNYTFNYWFHRLPLESPDLMVHILRMLAQLAVFKFLLFSHPELVDAHVDYDDSAREAGDDEEALSTALAQFTEALDRVAVKVFYKTARFMDHGSILKNLEKALEKRELRSIAGAVYLIRF